MEFGLPTIKIDESGLVGTAAATSSEGSSLI